MCLPPLPRDQSVVERYWLAGKDFTLLRAVTSRWPLLEVYVTSRLRELIQQLGEAIHESVIESEQIAGVVQDIRKHGFDVLLMLEATIGLNEVTKSPKGAELESEAGSKGDPFTQNDLHFLRSLRISVEGEDDGETTDAGEK